MMIVPTLLRNDTAGAVGIILLAEISGLAAVFHQAGRQTTVLPLVLRSADLDARGKGTEKGNPHSLLEVVPSTWQRRTPRLHPLQWYGIYTVASKSSPKGINKIVLCVFFACSAPEDIG
ncbi:hypothetical protein F4778DRAFT_460561 [Xylariomycetidae sp. FL2044]|nr:hypothetical protein F4778DRAFT_460561 [Xylariomycetidae sp. FL2044]